MWKITGGFNMKLKQVLAGALMLTTMVLGMTGCTKTEAVGLAGVQERGKIVVGLDDQFPPMGFRDEQGNIVGFDIDLAKEVANRIGVDVEFKPIVWDTKITILNQGEIDAIWNGFTITEERKKEVAFSTPYLENSQVIIVKNDSNINSKADLAGKKVGLQLKSSAQDAVEKEADVLNSFSELKKYEDNVQVFMDLEIGGIDAAVMDSVVARYQIKAKGYDYKVLEEDFGDEEYGIGVRLTDESLINEINKVMNDIKADGTYDEISARWFK